MKGIITRAQVLAHPVVIAESFGVKVLVRALFASARDTFLEIVTRCAEEEAHLGMADLGLARTVKRFIALERRLGALYGLLAQQLAGVDGAARFFETLASQEEGHAIVLSRVRREIGKGRVWKESKALHDAAVESLERRMGAYEEEVHRGVELARALDIVEGIEGSELNVVFDTLNGCVDMRSRARFERFFVMTEAHLAYCAEQVRALRARHGIGSAPGS